MLNALFIVIVMTLMGYISFYWFGVTAVMVEEARHERMKDHLNWKRGNERATWWETLFG